MNPNTPVLIGVGQFLNRIDDLDQALEPLAMMLEAVVRAADDTQSDGLLSQVQSVRTDWRASSADTGHVVRRQSGSGSGQSHCAGNTGR